MSTNSTMEQDIYRVLALLLIYLYQRYWLPLLCGGSFILPKPDCLADVEHLSSLMHREKITAIGMVPSILSLYVQEPNLFPSSLRYVFACGEILPLYTCRQFFKNCGYSNTTSYNDNSSNDDNNNSSSNSDNSDNSKNNNNGKIDDKKSVTIRITTAMEFLWTNRVRHLFSLHPSHASYDCILKQKQ